MAVHHKAFDLAVARAAIAAEFATALGASNRWAVISAVLAPLAGQQTRRIALCAGGIVLLALFVFHKAAHRFTLVASPLTSSVLVAVGFSYVILRHIAVMRALNESAEHDPQEVLQPSLLWVESIGALDESAYARSTKAPAIMA